MSYRNGNYTAFYVSEIYPDNSSLPEEKFDFCYYRLFQQWKDEDSTFPFIDSHDKTYNVRDTSDWETTLKPRIHQRLSDSKNIVLILSSLTKNSRALREEIDYGINSKGLPIIVIYPEYQYKKDILNSSGTDLNSGIKDLWDKLPVFRDNKNLVPTLHIPLGKRVLRSALSDQSFMVNTKTDSKTFYYSI